MPKTKRNCVKCQFSHNKLTTCKTNIELCTFMEKDTNEQPWPRTIHKVSTRSYNSTKYNRAGHRLGEDNMK